MGVLDGVRVLELAGQGPAPFAAMLLADMGADVVRVERPGGDAEKARRLDSFGRGRRSIVVDAGQAAGRDVVLALADRSDVLLEGFRPGVTERLGFGPEVCCGRNPALVYGRMTGWGQDGSLADVAGHDIDYIAVAGALDPIGRAGDRPVPPLAMVGDFGGGGMSMALGVCGALVERFRSGRGQVIDASCLDGASMLMTVVHHLREIGRWSPPRGTNLFDTGAPFYDVYLCADGRHLAVGAIEPRFYERLVERLGLGEEMYPQYDRARWPDRAIRIATVVATRTRDEWAEVFDGTEACVAPVLSPEEAVAHPQTRFVDVDGFPEPAPTPRFERTPSEARPRPRLGQHTDEILAELGLAPDRITELRTSGATA